MKLTVKLSREEVRTLRDAVEQAFQVARAYAYANQQFESVCEQYEMEASRLWRIEEHLVAILRNNRPKRRGKSIKYEEAA